MRMTLLRSIGVNRLSAVFSKNAMRFAFGLALVFGLSSCSAPTYNVGVGFDESIALPNGVYPSVEVDVVGVNGHDCLRLDGYPTDQYFQPGDKFRESLSKYSMRFSDGQCGSVTLSKDDPIWDLWNQAGITHVYVIANLPGVWETKFGKMDGRRLNLPVDSASWPDGKDISIVMKPGGLQLLTKMAPQAQDGGSK